MDGSTYSAMVKFELEIARSSLTCVEVDNQILHPSAASNLLFCETQWAFSPVSHRYQELSFVLLGSYEKSDQRKSMVIALWFIINIKHGDTI
jgi:hypothetical protein